MFSVSPNKIIFEMRKSLFRIWWWLCSANNSLLGYLIHLKVTKDSKEGQEKELRVWDSGLWSCIEYTVRLWSRLLQLKRKAKMGSKEGWMSERYQSSWFWIMRRNIKFWERGIWETARDLWKVLGAGPATQTAPPPRLPWPVCELSQPPCAP